MLFSPFGEIPEGFFEPLMHQSTLCLLLGHVLAHIQDAGNQDDRALDDVGDVAGDAQEGHAGHDQLHHEHAQDNAADLTGTTDEGYAADNNSRDGVGFVVQTQGSGRTAQTGSFHETGVAVQSASQHEHADDGEQHVNAGYAGSFFVGADGEHVLTEGGLVPDKPDDRSQDQGQ